MILQVKCPNCPFPPDGWPFTDPRTNKKWNGFEWQPELLANEVVRHRMDNPHVYSRNEGVWFDKAMVLQEIYQYKFRTHPDLFKGHWGDMQPASSKCVCGEDSWEEIVCPTCGGHRVTGYKCRNCGATKNL